VESSICVGLSGLGLDAVDRILGRFGGIIAFEGIKLFQLFEGG